MCERCRHDFVIRSCGHSTPVKESLEVIRERLQRHTEWRYTTWLEVDDITELIAGVHTYHHIFLFQWPHLQAEIRHSHRQPCFSTSGQHVHGAFRTETP